MLREFWLASNLNAVVTAKSYAVEIPLDLFDKLVDAEYSITPSIDELLIEIGAYKVDYNGHFGNYIFFNLYVADENKLELILSTIAEYLKSL